MLKKLLVVSLLLIMFLAVFVAKSRLSVSTKLGPSTSPTPYVPVAVYLDSSKVWQLIQKWRVSQGLKEYIEDNRLCIIANDRANEMFTIDQTDSHAGLYNKVNYYSKYASKVSENIVGALDEKEAFDKWLSSPAHLATLKSSFVYSCLRCKGMYCSQIFSNFTK